MNYPNNMKSPRASMGGMSINSQLGDVNSLQQSLLQKDQLISNLQGTINRLQLKNKQYSSYQQAMVQYQARAQEAQADLLKTNQKLRVKTAQCEQLKKKLDLQQKEKRQKAAAYVRQQDYAKLATQFKKYKQVHKEYNSTLHLQKKKNQQDEKYVNSLKQQIVSLNDVINSKNVEINDLKVEKYSANNLNSMNIKSNQSIQGHNDLPSPKNGNYQSNNNLTVNSRMSNNMISSFRAIGQQGNNSNGTGDDIQRINYQLIANSRQNDQLRTRCHKLEQQLQQFLHSSTEWSTQAKNKQYSKIIEEYEINIANMANKLTAVHKLEMQKSSLQQERRKLQIENQELRQELASRIVYCENLQNRLREIQKYKGISMQSDIQAFMFRNQKLTKQVEKLEKTVAQKYQQIVQLRKHFQTLQITEQTFVLMQQNLNSLEGNLNGIRQQLRKEQDKVLQKQEQLFKQQKQLKRVQIQLAEVKSQMAKTNRVVSQKVQKIQFQNVEIKRLEKENAQKKQISAKLAKLQNQYKLLDKKYEELMDESNQFAMSVIVLSAEIERRDANGNITKQFMYEFDQLKAKSKQTQTYSKHLEERVKRLEHLHKQVVMESMKVSQHLHASHKRWNHYDTAMDKLIQFLQGFEQSSQQKYEELDSNINNWLVQQDKRLKQLAKTDTLEDAGYIRYISKITTEPLNFDDISTNSTTSLAQTLHK